MGSHSLSKNLPDPGMNLRLLHWRQILYHLSHQGSPGARERRLVNASSRLSKFLRLERATVVAYFVMGWPSNRRRRWHPTPVLLPRKSHGRRSLEGCSPWGRWGSDTTERLHFRFSLSCIGEGNGNPLQCSCLENPRDGGAWGASVYGVTQSWTRLKWLSSSGRMWLRIFLGL